MAKTDQEKLIDRLINENYALQTEIGKHNSEASTIGRVTTELVRMAEQTINNPGKAKNGHRIIRNVSALVRLAQDLITERDFKQAQNDYLAGKVDALNRDILKLSDNFKQLKDAYEFGK